jgi:hypothetical protein
MYRTFWDRKTAKVSEFSRIPYGNLPDSGTFQCLFNKKFMPKKEVNTNSQGPNDEDQRTLNGRTDQQGFGSK